MKLKTLIPALALSTALIFSACEEQDLQKLDSAYSDFRDQLATLEPADLTKSPETSTTQTPVETTEATTSTTEYQDFNFPYFFDDPANREKYPIDVEYDDFGYATVYTSDNKKSDNFRIIIHKCKAIFDNGECMITACGEDNNSEDIYNNTINFNRIGNKSIVDMKNYINLEKTFNESDLYYCDNCFDEESDITYFQQWVKSQETGKNVNFDNLNIPYHSVYQNEFELQNN